MKCNGGSRCFRLDLLDDVDGALELLGPLLTSNPGDDQARRRYLDICARTERSAEAARLLSRALHFVKDPAVRARVGYDFGATYAALGDNAQSQTAFEQVIKTDGDADAVLASARRLVELYESGGDPKKRARALEVVTRLEPDPARRQKAAKTLAELSDEFKLGTRHALAAWRVLVDSDASDEGLQELQKDCENANDDSALAEVLELRARRSGDPEQARALALRSVELTAKTQPDAALARLRAIVERYGPSSDSYERMAELLEKSSSYEELAQVLDALARLARPQERAKIWAKLAKLRLERLADAEGALRAFKRSLEIDPAETTSRQSLERMLKKKEHRLEAAAILEPIFRSERKTGKLVELLELRAAFADDPHVRLRSLEEAAELVDQLGETERGSRSASSLSSSRSRTTVRACAPGSSASNTSPTPSRSACRRSCSKP